MLLHPVERRVLELEIQVLSENADSHLVPSAAIPIFIAS